MMATSPSSCSSERSKAASSSVNLRALRTKVSFPGGMRGRQRACPAHYRGVTPLARDALRMKPTKRLYVDLVRILYSLSALTCAHAGRPTRGSSTTRARTRPTRRSTTAAARRSPRPRREARMASSGSLLLGPVTALGLVPLLRLTTGRGRPPSGHRYCSNSFLRKVTLGTRCGRRGRRRAGVRRTPAAWLARRHWDTKRRGGSRSERGT